MLVLTRRSEESLLIGRDIRITVVRVAGGQVRIGIDAPPEVMVLREEVAHRAGMASAWTQPQAGPFRFRKGLPVRPGSAAAPGTDSPRP